MTPSVSCAGGGKCHPRNSDGGVAIQLLCVSSKVWVLPSVLVVFGRSCNSRNCGPQVFFFEEPPSGYAVLWSVGVGADGAPVSIRRGSRCITSIVVADNAQTADGLSRGRWPSVNMPLLV